MYKTLYHNFRALIDPLEIAKAASSLRCGAPCVIHLPEETGEYLMGGWNHHFKVDFADGAKWVMRVREKHFLSPPLAIRRMGLKSEVKSLTALHELDPKVPNAYSSPTILGRTGHVEDQLDYFFMDYVEGQVRYESPLDGKYDPLQIDRLIRDLVQHYIALNQRSFPLIGSLYPSLFTSNESTLVSITNIGPMTSRLIQSCEPPYFLGPFKNNKDRYLADIDHLLSDIRKGALYPDEATQAYLVYLELRDVVVRSPRWEADEGGTDGGNFYFKHPDDKGDHILVDEQGRITGIIDWEWRVPVTVLHFANREDGSSV